MRTKGIRIKGYYISEATFVKESIEYEITAEYYVVSGCLYMNIVNRQTGDWEQENRPVADYEKYIQKLLNNKKYKFEIVQLRKYSDEPDRKY
jgi:hypothetical protein